MSDDSSRTSQFLDSDGDLFDNREKLVLLDSGKGKGPYLLRKLEDLLTRTKLRRIFQVSTKNPHLYHLIDGGTKLEQNRNKLGYRFVSETKVTAAVTFLTGGLLIGLLVVGMWGLKVLGESNASEDGKKVSNAQLGVLTGAISLFGLTTLLLGASRIEVCASTAAYAAVLAVFVSQL